MDPLKYLDSTINRGISPGLERTLSLMQILGHPEDKFKSIHVTGTNGKGSVCAMLESILRKSGYRTGLYTSPHLVDVKERIQVNGKKITSKSFQYWIEYIRSHAQIIEPTLTYFELLTAVAFATFAENKVELALVEVGLGGRLDSTNILPKPEISIITNVSLEHTEYLGINIRSIAKEKGGIIKQNGVCLTGANGVALEVIKRISNEKKTKLIIVNGRHSGESRNPVKKSFWLDSGFRRNDNDDKNNCEALDPWLQCNLKGYYQTKNIQMVLKATDILRELGWRIPKNKILLGLKSVKWPARFEWSRLMSNKRYYPLLIDGAHNPNAIQMLLSSIQKTTYAKKKCLLVFNCLNDKNSHKMGRLLLSGLKLSKIFIPKLKSPRTSNPNRIKKIFLSHSKKIEVSLFHSVNQVWNHIKKIKEENSFDWVLFTGSLILMGEIRSLHKNDKR